MKNLMNTFKKNSIYLAVFALSLGFSSCSDDDDNGTVEIPETNASVTADAQVITQNAVVINSVTVEDDSWLTVRKVNEGGDFTEIIGVSELLEAGSHSDIVIELDNSNATDVTLEDGDSLVVQIHMDDGDGVFEFEGTTGADELITDSMGSAINDNFEVTAPAFTITDQAVVDNTIVFDNISTPQDSWIVLLDSDETGAILEDEIVGWEFVPAGESSAVAVSFEEGYTPDVGKTIYSRIFLDDPTDGAFTYETTPGDDMPAVFGFGDDDTITGSIVIQ